MTLPRRKSEPVTYNKDKPEIIEKEVKMTKHKGQFLIRIPKEISEFLEIKEGDKFKFKVEVAPIDKPKEKSKLKFNIVRK